MVRLGPIREEARAILATAIRLCEEAGELHGRGSANFAMNALYCADWLDIDADLAVLDRRAVCANLNDWTRNVSRFCADVLRWTHETERNHEMLALNVLSGMCVFADPDTKAPTNGGWAQVAYSLSEFLEYDVKASNAITLRHGRLSFDQEKRTFVFSWG
jgi:hypothetical protein